MQKEYAPLYQTWSLVKEVDAPPPTSAASSSRPAPTTTRTRELVQIARIKKRLTPSMLAERAGCDAETLSAFERGDEVLDAVVERRVLAALDLA